MAESTDKQIIVDALKTLRDWMVLLDSQIVELNLRVDKLELQVDTMRKYHQ